MRLAIRPTVRLRLTLLYGGLFVAAGVVLIALTYGLVNRALEDREPPKGGPGGGQFGGPGGNPGGNQDDNGGGFGSTTTPTRMAARSISSSMTPARKSGTRR